MTKNPLSQRDPRWADDILGFGTGTIGKYGCTITCLSMILKTTPDVVNKKMKQSDAFGGQTKNLVLWSALPKAFPEIVSTSRVRSYDNDAVKKAIDKNGACLVEVDGSRIGSSRHWVLYIGNQKMLDPWYGNEKTTSYYKPVGYAAINLLNRMGDMPTNDELRQAEIMRDRNWNCFTTLLKKLGIEETNDDNYKENLDTGILTIEKLMNDSKSLSGIKGEVTKAKNRVSELEDEIKKLNELIENGTSVRGQMNDSEWKGWAKNTLIFSAPVIIAQLGLVADKIPPEASWAILALFGINTAIDLLRKLVAGAKKSS